MKIWPWGSNPDYAIRVEQGTKGAWRWSLSFQGDTVALSPVKGWETAEDARTACHKVLDGIGAANVHEDEGQAQ